MRCRVFHPWTISMEQLQTSVTSIGNEHHTLKITVIPPTGQWLKVTMKCIIHIYHAIFTSFQFYCVSFIDIDTNYLPRFYSIDDWPIISHISLLKQAMEAKLFDVLKNPDWLSQVTTIRSALEWIHSVSRLPLKHNLISNALIPYKLVSINYDN